MAGTMNLEKYFIGTNWWTEYFLKKKKKTDELDNAFRGHVAYWRFPFQVYIASLYQEITIQMVSNYSLNSKL